jgi:hypothetical protein
MIPGLLAPCPQMTHQQIASGLQQDSGFNWLNCRAVLLQDPGVGGHFCQIAGLCLGPTRPDGASVATSVVFKVSVCLFLFVLSGMVPSLHNGEICSARFVLMSQMSPLPCTVLLFFPGPGFFFSTEWSPHKCAFYLEFFSTVWCLERAHSWPLGSLFAPGLAIWSLYYSDLSSPFIDFGLTPLEASYIMILFNTALVCTHFRLLSLVFTSFVDV